MPVTGACRRKKNRPNCIISNCVFVIPSVFTSTYNTVSGFQKLKCALKLFVAFFVFPLAAKEEGSTQKLDPSAKYLGNLNSDAESVSPTSQSLFDNYSTLRINLGFNLQFIFKMLVKMVTACSSIITFEVFFLMCFVHFEK